MARESRSAGDIVDKLADENVARVRPSGICHDQFVASSIINETHSHLFRLLESRKRWFRILIMSVFYL